MQSCQPIDSASILFSIATKLNGTVTYTQMMLPFSVESINLAAEKKISVVVSVLLMFAFGNLFCSRSFLKTFNHLPSHPYPAHLLSVLLVPVLHETEWHHRYNSRLPPHYLHLVNPTAKMIQAQSHQSIEQHSYSTSGNSLQLLHSQLL